MAREEQDREDLLKEAVALVERVEIALPAMTEHVIAGFRRDGSASLYFGPDPAYHFNTLRQLRRAYVDGLLYKAERGQLASLRRERSEAEVQLLRHDLDEADTCNFLARLRSQMLQLRETLDRGNCEIIGQEPTDAKILDRLKDWLATLPQCLQIAANPRVG